MAEYLLMNKDREVACFSLSQSYGEDIFKPEKQISKLPYGFTDINAWIDRRQAAKHRKHIAELMKLCKMDSRSGFIDMTRCASLTDTFWIKKSEAELTWDQVSLFTNPFDETIAKIAFDGTGMWGEQFSSTTPEFSTEGNFEKCWIREDDNIYLIKRGSEGAKNAGGEPYSEALSSQLAKIFNIDHVPYTLVRYHEKLASRCPLFTSEEHGFVSMNSYAITKGKSVVNISDVVDFCKPYGIEEDFFRMIVFDALILNTDRHLGNYGFSVNNDTGEIAGFAPVFDHNLSLLPYMTQEQAPDEYIKGLSPKIGRDFVQTAKDVMTKSIRADLINLKGFKFENPGYGFPEWKLETLSRIVNDMIMKILG